LRAVFVLGRLPRSRLVALLGCKQITVCNCPAVVPVAVGTLSSLATRTELQMKAPD
jgi:hypothetical protein